ncbi:SlyX family protein [Aquabacterium olei]|nr:SlyX family protein [Aquabacterium olei]
MPDKPMPREAETAARLESLEIKAVYLEDLVDSLNTVVARQQAHIDLLLHEVRRLREQTDEGAPPAFRSLRDELPPHY